MSIEIEPRSRRQDLVEYLRSTGYEGREPWIASLDPAIGSRIVAVRQLEACSTQPACAWRDDVDDDHGLWGFMRECLLEPLESFALVFKSTMPQQAGQIAPGLLARVWEGVSSIVARLRTADVSETSYPKTAIALLLAVMLLRQIVEAEAKDAAVEATPFFPFSTNVHPDFLPCLITKNGGISIDLTSPATLPEFYARLERMLYSSKNGTAIEGAASRI